MTEQISTNELLAEKTMDMSHAFYHIRHDRIIENLQTVLEPDELHILKLVDMEVESFHINWKWKASISTRHKLKRTQ